MRRYGRGGIPSPFHDRCVRTISSPGMSSCVQPGPAKAKGKSRGISDAAETDPHASVAMQVSTATLSRPQQPRCSVRALLLHVVDDTVMILVFRAPREDLDGIVNAVPVEVRMPSSHLVEYLGAQRPNDIGLALGIPVPGPRINHGRSDQRRGRREHVYVDPCLAP